MVSIDRFLDSYGVATVPASSCIPVQRMNALAVCTSLTDVALARAVDELVHWLIVLVVKLLPCPRSKNTPTEAGVVHVACVLLAGIGMDTVLNSHVLAALMVYVVTNVHRPSPLFSATEYVPAIVEFTQNVSTAGCADDVPHSIDEL
jgi:hypothetical protein